MKCINCENILSGRQTKYCSRNCRLKGQIDKNKRIREFHELGFTSHKLRAWRRKIEFIDQLGGCCSVCKYDTNLAALDFHHKEPSEKEMLMNVSTFAHITKKLAQSEIDKCILLCANCHREHHYPNLNKAYINEVLSRKARLGDN